MQVHESKGVVLNIFQTLHCCTGGICTQCTAIKMSVIGLNIELWHHLVYSRTNRSQSKENAKRANVEENYHSKSEKGFSL